MTAKRRSRALDGLGRKARSMAYAAGRAVVRASGPGPTLLANSFPKSGTHLLHQVLTGIPGVSDARRLVATRPPVRYAPRDVVPALRRLFRRHPSEVLRGHVEYEAAIAELLRQSQAFHVFIIRDPRDVVISEAHYLANMAPWHRLHRRFRDLSSDMDRIKLAIRGLEGDDQARYPDIGQRMRWYGGWLADTATVVTRFETLRNQIGRAHV